MGRFIIRRTLYAIVTLLILSAPYILTILISGVIRELRLLVPILLAQTFVYLQLKVDSGQAENSTTEPGPLRGLNKAFDVDMD